jgi:hypothetical protein
VRYLTGFTGSHGQALVVADAARGSVGPHRFLSDFRYATQSAEQIPDVFEPICSRRSPPCSRTRAGGSASTRRA